MTTQEKIKNAKTFFRFVNKGIFEEFLKIIKSGKFIDNQKREPTRGGFVDVREMSIVEKCLLTINQQFKKIKETAEMEISLHSKFKGEIIQKDGEAEYINKATVLEHILFTLRDSASLTEHMLWHIIRSTLPKEFLSYDNQLGLQSGFKIVVDVDVDAVSDYEEALQNKELYPTQAEIDFLQNPEYAFFYYSDKSLFNKILESIHTDDFIEPVHDLSLFLNTQNELKGIEKVYDMNDLEKALYQITLDYQENASVIHDKQQHLLQTGGFVKNKEGFVLDDISDPKAQEIMSLDKNLSLLSFTLSTLDLLMRDTCLNTKEYPVSAVLFDFGFFKGYKIHAKLKGLSK